MDLDNLNQSEESEQLELPNYTFLKMGDLNMTDKVKLWLCWNEEEGEAGINGYEDEVKGHLSDINGNIRRFFKLIEDEECVLYTLRTQTNVLNDSAIRFKEIIDSLRAIPKYVIDGDIDLKDLFF